MAGTVRVEFKHPEEWDLVMWYVHEQMRSFDEDNLPRPEHRILLGEGKTIVELKTRGDSEWLRPTEDGEE